MLRGAAAAAGAETSQPSTQATTQNTAQPTTVATPSGFVRFEVGGRQFIALPVDQPWIADAAGRAKSPTATTQPADMIRRLGDKRESLSTTMLADLPTLTPSQLDDFFDKNFLPLAGRLATITARPVYLVAPGEYIKRAVRAGWSDPRIYYNKAADTFEVSRSVTFDEPGKTDESVVIVLFNPTDGQDQRASDLSRYLTAAETDVQRAMTGRSNAMIIAELARFIADKGMNDLPRSDDQIWLADGLATVLAAKYLSVLHGASQLEFIRQLSMDPRDTPVRAGTIDLLHPLPADQLLPRLVQPYAAARHRKDVAVMYLWTLRAGDKQIYPLITAAARLRPADGPTLVKAVQTVSGVDLSADVARE